MYKINKYIFLLLLPMIFSLSSCDKFLDVNEDPVNPTSASEAELLTGIQANFTFMVLGGYPVRVTSGWMGYTEYTVAQSYDDYYVTENDVDNTWAFHSYSPVMNNCKILVEQAEAKDKHYYAAIAKIIWAYNTSILTDMFGNIPFTQALQPETYPFPAYDSQEVVYENIQRLLDEAIAHIDNPNQSSEVPGADDLVLKGDMQKWKKLAYSLKGRFYMRLSYAPGKVTTEQCQLALDALNQGIQSNDDNVVYTYSTDLLQENPWNQYAVNGRWNTFTEVASTYASSSGFFSGELDIRIMLHARKPNITKDALRIDGENIFINNTIYTGAPLGALYADPDSPVRYMMYSEACFLKAEASLLLGNKNQAVEFATEGMRADFAYTLPFINRIDQTEFDKAILNDPAKLESIIERYFFTEAPSINDSDESVYRRIAKQKHIAGFLTFESYNDYRRYPEGVFVTNIQADGSILKTRFGYTDLPKRFPYPSTEWQYNAQNVGQQGVPLSYESMTIPVWWDAN